MSILALNAGSSSLKFRIGMPDQSPVFAGMADGFGTPMAALRIKDSSGASILRTAPASLEEAAQSVLTFTRDRMSNLAAIGHRIVHGGPQVLAHCRIDERVRVCLEQASVFAPLHNPPALKVLSLAESGFAAVPQIACLDTAFHAQLPPVAARFPLPSERLDPGIRRYGFHGISCESIVDQLDPVPARLVIAHLGGGASVTAVRDGASVDTSMGLTPDGGIMMETRSGDLDPGLMIYLLRRGQTPDSLEQLLSKQSGIAGVSRHGGDLRDVRTAGDESSKLAIAMFVSSVAKTIAGMATVLGGIDFLAFSGGIGEHDAGLRYSVLEKLAWVEGFQSKVVPAQEENMILRHCARLVPL